MLFRLKEFFVEFKFVRYEGNPVLKPKSENQWENLCVLNPAVVFDDKTNKFVMVYRAGGDEIKHNIRLGLATSDDGYNFVRRSDKPIFDIDEDDADGGCVEDPRIVNIDGIYYMTYASRAYAPGRYWLPYEQRVEEAKGWMRPHADSEPWFLRTNETISYLAATTDFVKYKRLGRITDAREDDRDVVIFPRKINGKFYMISRPVINEDRSMWISSSDDLMEWPTREKLYSGVEEWESGRVGAGCPPIETKDGWLLIYHGVNKNDGCYRVGLMLLDKDDPRKILAKTKKFVLEPETDYEKSGLYKGCVFPTGVVVKDGIMYVYYGCADKYVSLVTAKLDDALEYLKLPENRL